MSSLLTWPPFDSGATVPRYAIKVLPVPVASVSRMRALSSAIASNTRSMAM